MSYTLTALNTSIDYMQESIDGAAIVNGGVVYTGDQMTVIGTISSGDETVIDGFVVGGQLEFAKEAKMSTVKTNTSNLIASGFTYSGKTFPLVVDSRSNYIGIQTFGGFPYNIQTINQDDVLNIADQAAYDLFVNAGLTRYRYIKDGESDLIIEVRDATTIPLVDAIVDTRT